MISKIRNKIKNQIDEIKQMQDSFKYADVENNKLMIALGYYGAICQALIKMGIEYVDELDLIQEHKQTQEAVQNLFKYTINSINNLSQPKQTCEQRLNTYLKMNLVLNYCLKNNITSFKIRYRDGTIFKKYHKIVVEDTINEINELMQECNS